MPHGVPDGEGHPNFDPDSRNEDCETPSGRESSNSRIPPRTPPRCRACRVIDLVFTSSATRGGRLAHATHILVSPWVQYCAWRRALGHLRHATVRGSL